MSAIGTPPPAAPAVEEPLVRLRREIEEVDARLVRLIELRVRLAREAGLVKGRSGDPVMDPEREAAVVRRAVSLARAEGLDAEAVRQLFWQIIGLCRRVQLPST